MLPYLHLERFSLTRRRAITRYGKCSVSNLGEKLTDIFGIKNTCASLTAVAVVRNVRPSLRLLRPLSLSATRKQVFR